MGVGALGLLAILVQVGDSFIQKQQEQDSDPEAGDCRNKGELAHRCGLLHGGDEQAPHGGGCHYASCEAGQGLPETGA